MSTAILLDTTAVIDALRGRGAAGRIRRLADLPFVTPITVEEVWRGARPSEEDAVVAFFDGARVLTIGVDEGTRAGRWRRDHAARGVTLHQADCLIAAVAVTHELTLATGNPGDFPFPELTVEHWPVGA